MVQVIVSLEWCPFSCIVNLVVTFYLHYVGVQYMSNKPERFIESNADHSWSSRLADELNLAIHIVESNPGFASVTNGSPDNSGIDTYCYKY